MRFVRLFLRASRLRCPECGRGKLFRGFFTMHDACSHCQLRFQREPGFYLGAIYVNYGLTALIVTVAYPLLTLTGLLTSVQALTITLAFAVLFPIGYFRHARSLWLAFDLLFDPQKPKSADRRDAS